MNDIGTLFYSDQVNFLAKQGVYTGLSPMGVIPHTVPGEHLKTWGSLHFPKRGVKGKTWGSPGEHQPGDHLKPGDQF